MSENTEADQPQAVPDMVLVPRVIIEALIQANYSFVKQMTPAWEGDPLSDAFDALRAALTAYNTTQSLQPLEGQDDDRSVHDIYAWLHDRRCSHNVSSSDHRAGQRPSEIVSDSKYAVEFNLQTSS